MRKSALFIVLAAMGLLAREISAQSTRPAAQVKAEELLIALQRYDADHWEQKVDRDVSSGQLLLRELSSKSDDELEKLLNDVENDNGGRAGVELILSEIVRRGTPHWEDFLKVRLDALFRPPKPDANGHVWALTPKTLTL